MSDMWYKSGKGSAFRFSFNRSKRKCVICDKLYIPKAPNQKYCPKCQFARRKGVGMSI